MVKSDLTIILLSIGKEIFYVKSETIFWDSFVDLCD